MGTIILQCTCKHAFQDAQYGKGNRVHNLAKNPAGGDKARCTVCKNEKNMK